VEALRFCCNANTVEVRDGSLPERMGNKFIGEVLVNSERLGSVTLTLRLADVRSCFIDDNVALKSIPVVPVVATVEVNGVKDAVVVLLVSEAVGNNGLLLDVLVLWVATAANKELVSVVFVAATAANKELVSVVFVVAAANNGCVVVDNKEWVAVKLGKVFTNNEEEELLESGNVDGNNPSKEFNLEDSSGSLETKEESCEFNKESVDDEVNEEGNKLVVVSKAALESWSPLVIKREEDKVSNKDFVLFAKFVVEGGEGRILAAIALGTWVDFEIVDTFFLVVLLIEGAMIVDVDIEAEAEAEEDVEVDVEAIVEVEAEVEVEEEVEVEVVKEVGEEEAEAIFKVELFKRILAVIVLLTEGANVFVIVVVLDDDGAITLLDLVIVLIAGYGAALAVAAAVEVLWLRIAEPEFLFLLFKAFIPQVPECSCLERASLL